MFWQKQTSVLSTAPDNFNNSYNGKVLTRGNVYKDSLRREVAQVSLKMSAQQKLQPINIAESLDCLYSKFSRRCSVEENPILSPLENSLQNPRLFKKIW